MKAIINGKVFTVTGQTYDKATILIENGKIKAHQAGSMTANEFDEFVRDHKLDEQE